MEKPNYSLFGKYRSAVPRLYALPVYIKRQLITETKKDLFGINESTLEKRIEEMILI